MANLNLSQFGENTSVSDADYTFVWDSAASISKKVSRNSWLNSGTLTSDAPVTISQTWNGTGSTVFKALVVNAAGTSGTNSASGSLLLDLQVNTATKFKITKNGMFSHTDTSGNLVGIYSNNNTTYFVASDSPLDKSMGLNHGNSILFLNSSGALAWTNQARGQFNESAYADTILLRDGVGQLALRNGALPQTFNVYGTYTSGSVYERLTLSAPSAANAIIGTNKGSGGGTARGLEIQTDGVTRMTFSGSGPFLSTLGAAANSQWLELSANSGTSLQYNSTHKIYFSAAVCEITANNTTITTGLFRFNGTTASFPAIKRSSTTLQSRLADDSDFAPIQGKLTTETAFTATTVTPTGFITLYDSTGAAYKVPCVPA